MKLWIIAIIVVVVIGGVVGGLFAAGILPPDRGGPGYDLTGTWSGGWWRSDGGEEGTLTASLIQSDSSLSGDLHLESTTYGGSWDGTISGSIEDNEVVFGSVIGDGAITIDYNGRVSEDGNQMSGTYYISTGYTGTWNMTSVG